MEAIKNIPRYTYNGYKNWEGRWELIDGIAYAMYPTPTPTHQRILARVAKELDQNFECNNKECEVYISFIDWKVSENTVVQPDVAIFCQRAENFFTTPPLLIVEVLSKATALKDVTTKFRLYEKQKVKYYIIVEPNSEIFDIYILQDSKYKHIKKGTKADSSEFKLSNGCKTKIVFSKVF